MTDLAPVLLTALLVLTSGTRPGWSQGAGSAESTVFPAPSELASGRSYECYREPVTVKTRSGRIVVACHAGNRLSWPERSGQDLAVRFSDNRGEDWSPLILAAEHGNFSVQSHGMVYDAQTHRILCLYVTYNWDYRAVGEGRGRKATAPIYERMHANGEPFLNAYMVHSDDDGETWSAPRDITAMTGGDAHFGSSEGRQLTLGDDAGRLILPGGEGRRMDARGVVTNKTVGVWISDDHGGTWSFSKVRTPRAITNPRSISCEARVSELPGGRLIYNLRTRRSGRHIAYSEDGGETWSEATRASDLKAAACNGCTLTLRDANGELTSTLLCSLPSPSGRKDGAIHVSTDGGESWPKRHQLTSGYFAYSALVQIDAETIGLFYEASHYREIRLQQVRIAELLPRPATPIPSAPTGRGPNILFIVSEDNSEQIGCYGDERVHTPALDSLARTGVRYTRAYVPYSVCSPSRAAFLTGLYPRQSGHIGLATHKFAMVKAFKTMPAYFQEAGYYTGFLGKTHINPASAVEDYIDHRAIPQSNFGKAIGIAEYARQARITMENAAEADKPFLLIVNYADAHRKFVEVSKNGHPAIRVSGDIEPMPWIGSDTPKFREEIRRYLNCMNRLDEGIGMLLEILEERGVRDDTIIVYISDHGADFPRSKGSVYEAGTKVPMIVNDPGQFSEGKVEHGMVSTMDILPTLLKAAGLPIPPELVGHPLQDLDTGRIPGRRYIHTFTTGSSPNLLYMQFAIRDERYKLIYNPSRDVNRLAQSRYRNSGLGEAQRVESFLHPPEFELYDLDSDPFEWTNLAGQSEYNEVQARLSKAMRTFQSDIGDPFAEKASIDRFIAEQKEHLTIDYRRKKGFRWPHLDMFER